MEVRVPSEELQDLIGDSADLVGCRCGIEHSLEQLAEEFTLPDGMTELLHEDSRRPRLEVFGSSYLLRIPRIAGPDDPQLRIEALHVVFHEDWLVVFEDPDAVGTAWHPGPTGTGQYFSADQAELTLTLIIEASIDSFRAAYLTIEDGALDCESSVFGTSERDTERVYRLGAEVSRMKSSLAALCRFIDRIPAPGASQGSEWATDMAVFSEDAHDILSHITHTQSRLTQLVAVLSTLIAQKQNEDMKRVSAWAAILFTPSLVGAVYGMNFTNIPELTWQFGYPLSILAMLAIGVGLYAVFRHQRWL